VIRRLCYSPTVFFRYFLLGRKPIQENLSSKNGFNTLITSGAIISCYVNWAVCKIQTFHENRTALCPTFISVLDKAVQLFLITLSVVKN
jgi:hypothetical protein